MWTLAGVGLGVLIEGGVAAGPKFIMIFQLSLLLLQLTLNFDR